MSNTRVNIKDKQGKIRLHAKDMSIEYIQQYYFYLSKNNTYNEYFIQFETDEDREKRRNRLLDELESTKEIDIKNQFYWKPFNFKKE